MKTTIDLPDALIQQAKQRALQQKRTLKDLIADYIRQGLKGTSLSAMSPRSALVETDVTGLPLIRATCAPTVHAPKSGANSPKGPEAVRSQLWAASATGPRWR